MHAPSVRSLTILAPSLAALRAALPLACLFALTVGCGENTMFIDTGSLDDAGGGADAGGGSDGGSDAPSAPGVCASVDINVVEELPASCLPRCAMETYAAAGACTNAACQAAVTNADTTPSVLIDFGGGLPPDVLDCGLCFNYQYQSCVFESCPDVFTAYAACAQMNPGAETTRCAAEHMALVDCRDRSNVTTIQNCANPRVRSCFF